MRKKFDLDEYSVDMDFGRVFSELRAVRSEKDGWKSKNTDSTPQKTGWNAYLIELSAPLLFSSDINEILKGEDFIIYPPIQAKKGVSPEIPTNTVYVPDGFPEIKNFILIKYDTLSGLAYSTQNKSSIVFRCHLLRIDIKGGMAKAFYIIRKFLTCVRSMCFQWWLLSGHNPFDVGARTMSSVSVNHEMQDISEEGEPKYVLRSQIINCGLEKILSHKHWLYLASISNKSFPADIPNRFFCDALEKFHLFEEDSAIMSISLALEAAEYEARSAAGAKSYPDPLRNLTKNPILLKYGDKNILKKLFIDRGHVAHSKEAPHFSKDSDIIKNYLAEAARILIIREAIKDDAPMEDLIVDLIHSS